MTRSRRGGSGSGPPCGAAAPGRPEKRSGDMSSIFYIIGVIVVIVFILSFLGLR
jgi:hypothetical protein